MATDISIQRAEKLRPQLIGSSIRAIQNHAKARKIGVVDHAAAQKIEVFRMPGVIRHQRGTPAGDGVRAQAENFRFQRFFHRIRKFHARMREQFHAIVVIRIVRCGDHHAGLKIILPHQAGNSGSGDDAGKLGARAGFLKTRGQHSRDMRTRFTRVHADQGMRGAMLAEQKTAQCASSSEKGLVIERRRSGNTANSIRAEKFFCHARVKV